MNIWNHTKGHGLTNRIAMLSASKIVTFRFAVIEK